VLVRYSSENKTFGQQYLLYRTGEVRANNCHFQEISSRKESHTSYHQVKLTKLLRKPNPDSENRTKERKFPPQESPTLQVVRLTRYRSNFPPSNHSQNGSSVVLCSFLTMVTAVFVEREESARKIKEPNLHRAPCLSSLGNSHPCRNATSLQAKIMTSWLFSLSYLQISKKTTG